MGNININQCLEAISDTPFTIYKHEGIPETAATNQYINVDTLPTCNYIQNT